MMKRVVTRKTAGFTLIELMIVVTILGILAAIAIPAFNRSVRRSKTSEAVVNLRRMFDGAVTSYQDEQVTRDGAVLPPRFPLTSPLSPAENSCCQTNPTSGRCAGNAESFAHSTWHKLGFSLSDPHFYWYTFESRGEGGGAHFTARANGNLDCDETFSTFERLGYVDLMGGLMGGAGIYSNQELE
ncbi:MAG: type IV pilin protein [Bradymonadia bacterium]